MTPEYIRLCRELQVCDWRGPAGNGWPPDARWIPKGARRPRLVANAGAPFKNEGATWLPREGDWLDLLEAEGGHYIEIIGMDDHTYTVTVYRLDEDGNPAQTWEAGDPDRLTALARLYAAVKGLAA